MMRKLEDIRFETNFTLYEFVESHPTNNKLFVALNWRNIKEFKINEAEKLAKILQQIRDDINKKYRKKNNNKEITLMITNAFRCLEWEYIKGRSGFSQHTLSKAADIIPGNCSKELAVQILSDFYKDNLRTFLGGLAIKHPTYSKDKEIILTGFIHIDNRGRKARWIY